MLKQTTTDLFDSAAVYEVEKDREELRFDSVEEAILEGFADEILMLSEADHSISGELAEWFASNGGVLTIYAFNHEQIKLEDWASCLVEDLCEYIRDDADTNGSCNDYDYDPFADVDMDALGEAIAKAIEPFSKKVKPWRCKLAAQRDFTQEQVEAILKAKRPSWFKAGE